MSEAYHAALIRELTEFLEWVDGTLDSGAEVIATIIEGEADDSAHAVAEELTMRAMQARELLARARACPAEYDVTPAAGQFKIYKDGKPLPHLYPFPAAAFAAVRRYQRADAQGK